MAVIAWKQAILSYHFRSFGPFLKMVKSYYEADLMQTLKKNILAKQPVLGLQHLLLCTRSILIPIMIKTALGYSVEQLTYLISMCGK